MQNEQGCRRAGDDLGRRELGVFDAGLGAVARDLHVKPSVAQRDSVERQHRDTVSETPAKATRQITEVAMKPKREAWSASKPSGD